MKVFNAILFISIVFNAARLNGQTYSVKKISRGSININGKGDAVGWAGADVLTNFIYPWENATAPATSFAAVWDGQWLYCLYRVKDDSVITYINKNEKTEAGASDRVEIFLKSDGNMSPYYCLELDASGRILDYSAAYYRKMNYNWQWPKGQLVVKTSRTQDGYIVETAIGIQSLKELGLLKGNRLQAGLFRAECKDINNGKADLRWISWVKPQSAEPDFHIPSAFGTLKLE
ncbi:carbohydrate-binding family 9-like protein [Terrimonas alba]|uniref:carbohydrate-binding family 9-like protein n=1 Tax=Terrimonas alba TaxID=3349636 RepID=UPI0035F4E88C